MKKWRLSAALSLAVFAGIRPGIANAQPTSTPDIGAEVRRVFANKCAGCHGPDLEKPRARFGYVLDLKRLAENPEIVIPSRPDESELWLLVSRDEMPPSDAPHGALSPEQKEIIRSWIAAGAPDASSAVLDSASSVLPESAEPAPTKITSVDRIIRWLGKFHPLLLHFPIALVLAAGAGEAWSVWQRRWTPSESVRFCLWLGALAAIPTVGSGGYLQRPGTVRVRRSF
jgi:mono/diheme cytochrome c family protein